VLRVWGSLRPLILTTALAALTMTFATATAAQTSVDRTLDHDGRTRGYRLYLPTILDQNQPRPLVFVLHGGGGNGAQAEAGLRYDQLAERDGWIVVYPDAVDGHWNDLRGFGGFASHQERVDDVGFIASLLAELATEWPVDEARVFVVGNSNGGLMAHTLGAHLADRVAAIAPVIGSMARPVYEDFHPSRPVSVLLINYRSDPLVQWNGGESGRSNFVSIPETATKWQEVNGCTSKTTTSPEARPGDPDDSTVNHTVWEGCSTGTHLELYSIEGNRHRHPTEILDKANGRRTDDVIWDFFARSGR